MNSFLILLLSVILIGMTIYYWFCLYQNFKYYRCIRYRIDIRNICMVILLIDLLIYVSFSIVFLVGLEDIKEKLLYLNISVGLAYVFLGLPKNLYKEI